MEPEVHYRIATAHSPAPIMSQINLVHASTPLLEDPF